MADLTGYGIDPNVPENSGGFKVYPPGSYNVVIVNSRVVSTADNTGKILELKLQFIAGEYAGDTIVDRINIINKSAQAQAIGQGQLKRICSLTGCPFPPSDTTMMHGKPLQATIKVEKFISNKSGKELDSNKVAGYNQVPQKQEPVKMQSASAW